MSISPTDPVLDVAQAGDRLVARVANCDSLTDANIDALNQQFGRLLAALAGRDGWHLLVDLSGIGFASSAAVAAFLGVNKRAKAARARFTLINARPTIRQVFQMTRLDKVVEIRTGPDPDGP